MADTRKSQGILHNLRVATLSVSGVQWGEDMGDNLPSPHFYSEGICACTVLLYEDFGVAGMPLDWLRSYLSNRSYYVKLGRHSSPTINCTPGVPQG